MENFEYELRRKKQAVKIFKESESLLCYIHYRWKDDDCNHEDFAGYRDSVERHFASYPDATLISIETVPFLKVVYELEGTLYSITCNGDVYGYEVVKKETLN